MMGDLKFNERREQMLYAWSSTRDQFHLTIEERSPHPCIQIGPPRPLDAAERVEAVRTLRAAGLIGPTKWRAAYAIPILVHERRDGAQLDLGPLSIERVNHAIDDARTLLANEGYDPVYGARPLKRVIQNRLQNALANAILTGEFPEGSLIKVDAQHGELTFARA